MNKQDLLEMHIDKSLILFGIKGQTFGHCDNYRHTFYNLAVEYSFEVICVLFKTIACQ